MNIEKKIGRGLAFLLLSTAGSRLVALGANVALARLLLPGDWGLMAFALLVVNTLGLLRSMGVGEALIHRRRADQEGNDAGFFLVACLGLALYGAIYAGAPWIALWAEEAERWLVVRVLRWIGLLVVFQALAAVPIALLERELEFEQKLYTEALPALVYAALAVLLAWWGWGIWSLVWGRLAAALVTCAAAWFFSPWHPRARLSWKHLREVAAYGRYVAGAAVVSFLVVNVDDALLVRLAGTEVMGLYAMAYLFANLPATSIAHIVNRVAFPAYARLEDAGERAVLYGQFVRLVALFALPVACVLALLARPFVLGILGPQWSSAIPILQWLAGYGLLRSLLSNSGPLFNAAGMPQAILKVNLLQLALLGATLYPLIRWQGAVGASVGIVVGTVLSAPLAFRYLKHIGDLGPGRQFAALWPLLGPGLAMAVTIAAVQWGFGAVAAGSEDALGELVCAGGCGVLVYSGVLYWRQRSMVVEMWMLLRGQRHE